MINYIWLFMILSGVIAASVEGKIGLVTTAALKGAADAISVSIGLVSIMIFWLGIMKIAEDSGLLQKLARLLRPIIRLLFPSVPTNHPAEGYILSNMSANLFGLGNVATPLGIKAMEELQKLNPDPKTATPAMCTLLAINTAGITLIPATIIGLRIKHGATDPTSIIGPTLFATCGAMLLAILLDRYYQKKHLQKSGQVL